MKPIKWEEISVGWIFSNDYSIGYEKVLLIGNGLVVTKEYYHSWRTLSSLEKVTRAEDFIKKYAKFFSEKDGGSIKEEKPKRYRASMITTDIIELTPIED